MSADSERLARAAEVFDSYLERLEAGEAPDFEELCARHAAVADALRALKRSWELLDPPPLEASRVKRFADRLHGQPGEADAPVRLVSEGPTGFAAEVLARMASRGETGDRYLPKGELAKGGQGVVLRVWDTDLRRHLAMKVMLGQGDIPGANKKPRVDSPSLGRFLEEAQVTAQLDHPGIVPVHELGLDAEGRVYFTMKLVKGENLRSVFAKVKTGEEGWTQTRALGVLLKVCEAMSYAHAKSVIHRDLKPGNVMVGRYGEVYVMDWGLARILGQEDRRDIRISQEAPTTIGLRSVRREHAEDSPDSPLVTMGGDVVGTPAYMPPEQARGDLELMGPPSDVYAVGTMLYHLLVGHIPYVKPGMRLSNYAVLYRVQEGPPDPLHLLAPEAPAELIAICEKAMARDWGARYRDMGDLAQDLRAYLEHRVVRAYQTGAVAEFRKWVGRNRRLAAVATAGLFVLVIGLVVNSELFLRKEAAQRDAKAIQDLFSESMTAAIGRVKQSTQSENDAAFLARDWLDRIARRVDSSLQDRPEVRLAFETMLINGYQAIFDHWSAYVHSKHALDLLNELRSDDIDARAHALISIGENIIRISELLALEKEELPPDLMQEAASALSAALNIMKTSGRKIDLEIRQLEGSSVYLSTLQSTELLWPQEVVEYIAGIWEREDVGEVRKELDAHTHQITEHWNAGRHEEAKQVFIDDIEKYLKTPGDWTFYWGFLGRMAAMAKRRSFHPFAEAAYSLAIDVARKNEREHDVLVSQGELAALYQESGRVGEALALLERIYPAVKERYGATEKMSCQLTRLRAGCLARMGGMEDSITALRDLKDACVNDVGPEYSEVVPTLRALGAVLVQAGRVQEAEQALEEAAKIPAGENYVEKTGRIRGLKELASARIALGKHQEAETAMKLAWSELRGITPPVTLTRECQGVFVELYQEWGKYDQADMWR